MRVQITKPGWESARACVAVIVRVDDHGKDGGRILVDDPEAARTLLAMIGRPDDNATRVEIGLKALRDIDYVMTNGQGGPAVNAVGELKVWNPTEGPREDLELSRLGFKVLG